MMELFFLYAAIYLSILMLLSLYRAVFGPTVLDRLIGVNAIGSKTTALLILIGTPLSACGNVRRYCPGLRNAHFIAVLAASRYFQKRKGLYEEPSASKGLLGKLWALKTDNTDCWGIGETWTIL